VIEIQNFLIYLIAGVKGVICKALEKLGLREESADLQHQARLGNSKLPC
jgi:hypothetical protein